MAIFETVDGPPPHIRISDDNGNLVGRVAAPVGTPPEITQRLVDTIVATIGRVVVPFPFENATYLGQFTGNGNNGQGNGN